MIDLCCANTSSNDQNIIAKDKTKLKFKGSALKSFNGKVIKEVGSKKESDKKVKAKTKISLTKSAKKRLNRQRKNKS